MFLFGGEESWNPGAWIDSDDRVRGGKSQSFFDCNAFEPVARFHGELDIKTLGGAGFASQRTTGENRSWDLSRYDGIQIEVTKSDAKRYTLILKDELLPKNPDNGREQSTVSYEYGFALESKSNSSNENRAIFVPFKALRPTYRGREKSDAAPLNLKSVKRFSIMMRSFFGDQEGTFSLSIKSISAAKSSSPDGNHNKCLDTADIEVKEKQPLEDEDAGITRQTIARRWSYACLLIVAGGIFYTVYQAYPLIMSRL